MGPATLSPGGCVGNTGIALHRLGARPILVARVGDDPFGRLLLDLLLAAVPGDAARVRVVAGSDTSYSLIASQPGLDRAIEHFPGVNDTFVADDVPQGVIYGAAVLHIGYPSLMAALIADEGLELATLLRRARRAGLTTSLDMAAVDGPRSRDGTAWLAILERVLPEVDVCLPSFTEASRMLGGRAQRPAGGRHPMMAAARLAGELIDLGVAVAGIKLGDDGLYIRTAGAERLSASGAVFSPSHFPTRASAWARRELHSAVFETDVVGTTGAGDSTIAGFLLGLLTGATAERAMTMACAVGAFSTEAASGTSGVPAWPIVARRLESGWLHRGSSMPPGWAPASESGIWIGPADVGAAVG